MLMTKVESRAASERALEGRTAILTGSTSGIGLGIAEALARGGANIVLNGFGEAAGIERVRAGIAAQHRVNVLFDGTDMSKADAIGRMVARVVDAFGHVDILVNNAGIQHVLPIESFPPEKWDAVLAVDLSSAFHTTRAVFAGMKARKWGRIVNVASAHGLIASPFKAEAWSGRPDQSHGTRGRRGQCHLQRGLSRLRLDAAGGEAGRRSGEGARHHARGGDPRRAPGAAAEQALRHRGGVGCAHGVPLQRRRRLDHRRRPASRRRLDRALTSLRPISREETETWMAHAVAHPR